MLIKSLARRMVTLPQEHDSFASALFEESLLKMFVILVLLVTFKSVALPLLLILVIQGSVWINFSFPALLHNNLYFLAYLIVSAIMMGANIDYAIVISSRYLRLKEEMPYKEAMIEALNQAFPTVVTSGTILAAAGMSIGFLSSENTVASIGICLGRGTLISMVLVMCVLPQILLLGDYSGLKKHPLRLATTPRAASAGGHACQWTRARLYQRLRRCGDPRPRERHGQRFDRYRKCADGGGSGTDCAGGGSAR